uniref:Uncharacterized protein n=1 Tax=Aegilops tauschii subsp. strangulata TaxID=200361 RepID=A0A453G7M9_AEGTS
MVLLGGLKVRAAVRVPEQHPGDDDQRRGVGDRGNLRGHLPHLRGAQGQDPDAGPPQRGHHHLRHGGAGVAAGAARQGSHGLLRPRRHRLLHLHVRLAALHHEVGDQDQERGVHAVPAVALRVPLRHLLVHLRPARPRPLHLHPQRVRELPGPDAAHPLRHLPEEQGPRCRRRAGRQGGGRRRRGRRGGGRQEGGRGGGDGRGKDQGQ